MATLKPVHAELIGDTFAVRWSDNAESFLPLETMRRACPCAACGGEPDVLGRVVRPEVSYNEASFRLRGFEYVGGYAIRPTWEDGHNTGIYSHPYLRRIDEACAPTGGAG